MSDTSILWLVGTLCGFGLLIVRRDEENVGKLLLATFIVTFLFLDSLDLSKYSKQIETGKFYLGWAALFTLFILLVASIIKFFDRRKGQAD